MITLFLTSSPFIEGSCNINPANAFKQMLLLNTHKRMRCTFVSARPSDIEYNNGHARDYRHHLELMGLTFAKFDCLDNRNAHRSREIIKDSDMLIMGGGHVPTQNNFFQKTQMAEILKDFQGVIVGISAGSMNCASQVYSIPEHDGEAVDPEYKRFFTGLGLTDIQIIPHQNKFRNFVLDGLRWYEDIALPDSVGHRFYSMPDGSFYFQKGDVREFHGETWLISNNTIRQICENGNSVSISEM